MPPSPEEILAASLLESYVLPLLALFIAIGGRRVIEGAKFNKWNSSADIAMDATLIGATACGTVFVSPFLEKALTHTAGYASLAVLVCVVFWVILLGNRTMQPKNVAPRDGQLNLLLGLAGLFFPAFFFIWGYVRYKR